MNDKDLKDEKRVLSSGLFILTAIIVFYAFYYRSQPNVDFNNRALEPGTFISQQLNKEAAIAGTTNEISLSNIFKEQQHKPTLLSAYTDPLGKKLNIKYILPDKSPLFVELYNENGQRVMAWDAGQKDKGEYLMSLGVDHLNAGNYYYHFIAGDDMLSGRIEIPR